MLDPSHRRTYFEMVRPPVGYTFDCGIGTSYSVDLMTVMMIPMALALLDAESNTGEIVEAPIALLESTQRFSERILIFHEPGKSIAGRVPTKLAPLLENMLFPTLAPSGGSFHPKVWVLRYKKKPTEDDPESPEITYRLLNLSRNMTFDKSWDISLTLDGPLLDRKRVFARNRPVQDFLLWLPQNIKPGHSFTQVNREITQTITDEILRVDFELPEPFEQDTNDVFIPIGLDGKRTWPFKKESGPRCLVVSPFLKKTVLRDLSESHKDVTVISTLDEINALSDADNSVEKFYHLNTDHVLTDDSASSEPTTPNWGLHAKIYIFESGHQATVYLGSANATNAAYEDNIEFLACLRAKKSQIGIDKFLDGIKPLLLECNPEKPPHPSEEEQIRAALQETTTCIQRVFSRAALTAVCNETDNRSCCIDLHIPKIQIAGQVNDTVNAIEIQLSVELITQNTVHKLQVQGETILPIAIRLDSVLLGEVSTLWSITARVKTGAFEESTTWIQSVPTTGIPEARNHAIVRSVINDKSSFRRYLSILLLDPDRDPSEFAKALRNLADHSTIATTSNARSSSDQPLFEQLVTALADAPDQLDRVNALVNSLGTSDAEKIIPEGFADIWSEIWKARQNVVQ